MIALENITAGHKHRTVFHRINLELPQGVIGLVGPNGAGKTTLLRTLATTLTPHHGHLVWNGRPLIQPTLDAYRATLGYLPQQFRPFPRFSVRAYVRYVLLMRTPHVPEGEIDARVERAIHAVGLSRHSERKMSELSGGELQRAGIAQAIVNRPDVLLLDEPTVGLDPDQRIAFRRLLRSVGSGRTVVISTHLLEDVESVCDHLVLIHQGAVLYAGAPSQLAMGVGASPEHMPIERAYQLLLRQHGAEAPEQDDGEEWERP